MTTQYLENMIEVNTEEPSKHWGYVSCKDEVVVDLGCGRWEHVEYRDPTWPTTPEYFVQLGAKMVYAFDVDPNEIEWFNQNICNKHPVYAETKHIHSVLDVRTILRTCNPSVVKCDIEKHESAFLSLEDFEFRSVRVYAIETHSDELFDRFIQKFITLNYKISAVIDLIHARPMKVIFAERIDV